MSGRQIFIARKRIVVSVFARLLNVCIREKEKGKQRNVPYMRTESCDSDSGSDSDSGKGISWSLGFDSEVAIAEMLERDEQRVLVPLRLRGSEVYFTILVDEVQGFCVFYPWILKNNIFDNKIEKFRGLRNTKNSKFIRYFLKLINMNSCPTLKSIG